MQSIIKQSTHMQAEEENCQMMPKDREQLLEIITSYLFDTDLKKKKWIINLLLQIEDKELINVHRFFSQEIMRELKRISEDATNPELQADVVDLFASILEGEVNDIEYLLESGIIQNYLDLLPTANKDLFAKLAKGIEYYYEYPHNLDRLVQLKIIDKITENIHQSSNAFIECWQLLGNFFDKISIHLKLAEVEKIYGIFMAEAVKNFNNLSSEFKETMLKFCKYIFKNDLHEVFAENGNIVFIVELFQDYPRLIRLIFKKLSHRPQIMKHIISQQYQYLFATITEVIPTAKLTLTLALVEILCIILEQDDPKYVALLWKRDDILDQLKSNLSIEKDLTSKIFQIYHHLIAHKNYDEISAYIPEKGIADNIIEAIAVERTPEVIQNGLRIVCKILEFESQNFKDEKIKSRVFTREIRNNDEAGEIMVEINQKRNHQSIKNLAYKILSQNFVKIEGKIMSIDQVCKKS